MPELSGMIQEFLEGSIKSIGGKQPVIQPKTITENGTYNTPSGVDGFNPVVVNVPSQEPNIQPKSIFENGTYNVPSGIDGFNPVVVDVPSKEEITLYANQNGTYTPDEGKVYNNVVVNVPLPQNAYLLKSVANLPQAIASFNDGEDMVMPSLKVAIEPQQEGSGDPSPTNVRPISGWNVCNVSVADDAENPIVSNVYTIDLDGTRYGGTLDVISGVLTVDRKYLTIDNFNSSGGSGTSAGRLHWYDVKNEPEGKKFGNKNICSICGYVQNGWTSTITVMSVGISETIPVRIYDSAESLSEFKDKYPNLQLVYELATPITIQLTPIVVKSLLGNNNVWADTGDITDAEYFSKEANT